MSAPNETEIKYRVADPSALRSRLEALGARRVSCHEEENQLFDDGHGSLQARGLVLRLRVLDGGPAAVLTLKGPASFDGPVKSRSEREATISDAAAASAILQALGCDVTMTYQKTREEWALEGIAIALDTLAVGCYCELEGERGAILGLAARLGLPDADVELQGYPALVARQSADV